MALRILIADDNPLDADLEVRALKAAGLEFEHLVVSDEQSYRAALRQMKPDVVLCGFAFPEFDGLTALHIVRDLGPATPLIFISKELTEERAALALQNGAADYVLKSNLLRLPDAVTQAVERASEYKQRFEAEARLIKLSRTKGVLSAVNSAIVRLRDKPELFREACRIAVEEGGFPYAFIMTISPAGDVEIPAILGNQTRSTEEVLALMQNVVDNLPTATGAVAQSLRSLQPVALRVSEHSGIPFRKELLQRGINAIASLPFVIGGRAIGAMIFAAYDAAQFDPDEIELIASLTNNLAFAMDLIEKQQRVDYLSYYDPLTELPNRTLFYERLRNALAVSRRTGDLTALMLLDIQQFAQVNATLGQRAGDEILRECGRRLCAAVGSEHVARLSGDRFAVCFPSLTDLQPVIDLLSDRGIRMFENPFFVLGREITLNVRAGFAVFPQDGEDIETLSQNAEIALQNARLSSANYQFYSSDLGRKLEERLDLEARLAQAEQRGEFVLHYQPKVDVDTRQIVGIEALIRWRDPDRPDGLVPPGAFIPALEQTGLIVQVGRWAMHEAARQYASWKEAGLPAPRIAVNLSARQLRHPFVVEDVRSAVSSCGTLCGIELEITESMLMENIGDAAGKLREIRALGVEIALDDFGTGYSSLAALHQLPISAIKIDRSFVSGMADDADKTSMIATIISLARSLRLKVIAEGVETEEEARLLRVLQCDQMQGYLIARPAPAEELGLMLNRC